MLLLILRKGHTMKALSPNIISLGYCQPQCFRLHHNQRSKTQDQPMREISFEETKEQNSRRSKEDHRRHRGAIEQGEE